MDGTWEGYFYPETINPFGQGTLINKLGERDQNVLRDFEYAEATERTAEILDGTVQVEQTFDADHLKAIHRHLFGNVYPWAGEFRTVDFGKSGEMPFAAVSEDVATGPGFIGDYLADVHDYVTRAEWADMNRSEFVAYSATVLAAVNQAHPFREGNGRTQKLFLEQVALQSPFTFDGFKKINVFKWNAASEASRPTAEHPHIQPLALMSVLDGTVMERATKSIDAQFFQQRVTQLGANAAMAYLRPRDRQRNSDAAPHRVEPYRGHGHDYGTGTGLER